MEEKPRYVGIDVSKAQVDVAVRPTGQRWVCVLRRDRRPRNWSPRWWTWGPPWCCWRQRAVWSCRWWRLSLLRRCPWWWSTRARFSDFARATGTLAKTDSLDAAVLAHFADAVRPSVRPLRDAETQILNSLTARRHQVLTMLVSEKNRLGTAISAVRPRIEAHIAWLEQELSDLDEGAEAVSSPKSSMA